MTSDRRALYGLMLVALLVRLATWPWFAGVEPQSFDEGHYVEIATNLAERGEFRFDDELTSVRPPLYPAMVSVVYRLAGVGSHQAVRLLQIFLNVAIVPLVFAVGRRLYDQRTGLVAAAIAGFYPSLWGHDYLMLTEVLFTLLLVAGTVALVEHTARPHWSVLVAAGVAFGLGTLTRTTLLFYPAVFAATLFAFWRAPSSRRIAAVGIFVAAFAITVAPWIARNTRLNHRLSSVDSFSNETGARFSPLRVLVEEPGFVWYRQGRRNRDAALAAQAAEAEAGKPRSPAAARAAQKKRAKARDRTYPIVRALRGIVWDGSLFWRIDRELAGMASRGWLGPLPRPVVLALAAVVAAYYVVLMLAGVIGVVLRPPPDRLRLALVLSVIVTLAGVHALSVGHSRYHVPLMPLVAMFAARLWVARSEPVSRRRLAVAVTLAVLMMASWTTSISTDLRDARKRIVAPLD